MSLLGPRVFTKSGAEGVFCAALPEAGLGLAVKADDGAGRAAQVMIAALIRRFGGFDDETERALHALRLAAPLELERRRSRALASRGSAGLKSALMREGQMGDASTTRRRPSGAAALLRLAALASLAFIPAVGVVAREGPLRGHRPSRAGAA